MARRRRIFGQVYAESEVEPLIRLWALRILVLLNGRHQLVERDSFSNDGLASYVGLDAWLDVDEDEFDKKAVHAELRTRLKDAEKGASKCQAPACLTDNIARLAELLGLSEAESRVLEFIVLIKNDSVLDDAGDLLGTINSARLEPALSAVLRLPLGTVKNVLSDSAILIRSGLLSIDHSSSLYLASKIDLISDDFADRICARETDPIDLLRETVVRAPQPELVVDDYVHITPSLAILRPYLQTTLDNRRKGVNILLHGVPGTGKTQLPRVLAKVFGCDVFEVSSETQSGDPVDGAQRLRAYRAAQSILGRSRVLLVFDEAEDVYNDGGVRYGSKSTAQLRKSWINRALEENTAPTFWLSNGIESMDPAFIRRFDMVVELPVPPRAQRETIIRRAGGDLLDERLVRRMAESENLAPALIGQSVEVIRSIQADLAPVAVGAAVELLVSNTLQAQGHRPIPRAHDPNSLPETYDPFFIQADVDLAEVARGLACDGSGRLCLYGPPGTGKTAYGRWLAGQLNKPLLVKRASDLISMWVGGTEKNIAEAFSAAEREGAVLLIDEVDSFLQDRRGASRSWEVTAVNEMLTQMEAYPGVFVASTNLMSGLDQAALRRFDLKVQFGFLDGDQAWALFMKHCAALSLAMDARVRHELRSLDKLTPGDFAAVTRQHRFRPLRAAADLVSALRRECAVKESGGGHIGFV